MTPEKIRKKLFEILLESLSFQYSSAASMYILDDQRPPKKFGSNCYEQARNTKIALQAAGFEKTYFVEDTIVGRHRSIICETEAGRFLFCPYFMHLDLIHIDAIQADLTIDAYPIVEGIGSTIAVTRTENRITITKSWPRQERIDRFTFDLDRHITSDIDFDDYVARAIHPEQSTLSIRFLNTTTGAIDHLACAAESTNPKETLHIRTNEGEKIFYANRDTFETKLADLTTRISATDTETIKFLLDARALRDRLIHEKPKKPKTPIPFPY